nr:ATP synthase F0 subunit 8 [Camellia sinensis]
MPQLDKFTYFTQFFWSCLFLFTFYIGRKFFFPFHLGERLYFIYLFNKRFQQIVFCFQLLFLFFICFRVSSLLYHNLKMVFFQKTIFGILPCEMSLLNHYLNQPNQDPEWVEFVRQGLQTQSLSPSQYEVMVRDFLNTEMCVSTREKISVLYQILFYGREDPQFFIDPIDLDYIIHVYLEKKEFNHPALAEVLLSLSIDRENSPFYTEVKTTQAKQGFLNLKKKAQLDLVRRNHILNEAKALENRIQFLQSQNASLKDRLFSER